jgi:uncharacterized protein YndB with AHSA1/START domain
MTGHDGNAGVPDVRKSITVAVPPDAAFQIFTERPAEWLPPAHTFMKDPRLIAIESRVGGRFYERGADGNEITRGTITEWAPPSRLVVTWRIGPHWQPVFDDDNASLIEVDFVPVGPDATEVIVTNTHLDRHGEMAGHLRSVLDAANPGETLQRYGDLVARHG